MNCNRKLKPHFNLLYIYILYESIQRQWNSEIVIIVTFGILSQWETPNKGILLKLKYLDKTCFYLKYKMY